MDPGRRWKELNQIEVFQGLPVHHHVTDLVVTTGCGIDGLIGLISSKMLIKRGPFEMNFLQLVSESIGQPDNYC